MIADVLVIGAGPAALAIASELISRGLQVHGLSAQDPAEPWQNTYGIWGREVDRLGLGGLLGHRWSDSLSYFNDQPLRHVLDYGLFDRAKLQNHWLSICAAGAMVWHQGQALALDHGEQVSTLATACGQQLQARLVVDASGHQPVFVQRPYQGPVAGQAAYGVVGRFSAPPVQSGQFVLMDYRSDHLGEGADQAGAPTFLYAMDLGDGLFFAEETSLALAPPVPFEVLKDRLHRRLAHGGIQVEQVEHEEFCLFPMNLPLPDLSQQVVGFGGAASMVHPASGYMVGSLLRRAPTLADAIAQGLGDPALMSPAVAAMAWQALWPLELRRKHALYCFGLEKLMRYPSAQLRQFFATFFALPQEQWYGFLTNTLSLPELVVAMLRLFAKAPWSVRWGLMQQQGRELVLLGKILNP